MTRASAGSLAPWWAGLPVTVAATAGWVLLAVTSPTTTYHFAPAVVAAAWPVARRMRVGQRLSAKAVSATVGGGIAVALIVTLALALTGALLGPTFFGSDGAVVEVLVMIAVGALIGVAFAVRSARALLEVTVRMRP